MHEWMRLAGPLLLVVMVTASADTALGRENGKATAASSKKASKRHGHASKKRAMRGHGGEVRRGQHEAEPETRGRPARLSILEGTIRCPPDMVAVAGRVCVDRYETSLVDVGTGRAWPPFYAPSPTRASATASFYESLRTRSGGDSLGALMPIPEPPPFSIEPRAVSAEGVLPQGYLTADVAESACRAANKRLCTEAEWVTACQGESETEFPYGPRYEQGACNVYRESHPSFLLHDNAARYHDDPRNNLVTFEGRSLLDKTGASPRCASKWGGDAVFDMVGNLDEWVSDERGVFVGGFYSRGTRSGCFARVSSHPRAYSDYSTGARCCADPSDASTASRP